MNNKTMLSSAYRTFSLIWLLLFVFCSVTFAQTMQVKGKVVDSKQEPLIGVNVVVKGTTNGTITDFDGNFILTVSKGETLQFSYIGFTSKDVVVTSSDLVVEMKEDTETLDEVVVVGYGTQKKGSLTGAITAVKSEELVKTTTPTTAGALVGKAPGISARQADGRPGASASIQIRNMGTPLYVIDGIQCEEGQFNNIDVNDIESITVLKDASAAIYGLRAANGVVLVTTKSGKRNEKSSVSANFYYGMQNFMRYPEVADAATFYEGRMQADLNTYGSTARTMDELNLWRQGQGKYSSFDWQDFIVNENAPMWYGNVSIDGGSEAINYHVGISHTDQDAMIHGFNFQRTNIQSNVEANITPKFKVGVRVSGRIESRHNVGVPGLDDYWQPYYAMFQNWPTQHAYANDNPNYVNETRNNATGAAIFDEDITGYTDDVWKSGTVNAYAEWQTPLEGLKARVAYNYWIVQNDQEQFEYTYDVYRYDEATDTYTAVPGNLNPWRRRIKEQRQEKTFQAQLNYDHTFDNAHHVSGVLGIETFEKDADWTQYNTLPSNNYISVTNGISNMQSLDNTVTVSRRAGLVFRAAYDYRSKYFAEFSGRYDGSYLFAEGHRWGFFPSVSGGWRISEEPFMENVREVTKLSNLKIRASWGQMGDDQYNNANIVTPYAFLDGYTYGNTADGAVLDGNAVSRVEYRGIPVTNLSWIKSTLVNVGLDFGFFDDRLSGTFELFQRKRTGLPAMRYDVLVPVEVGFDLSNENLNSDYHKGLEFGINWRDQVNDFRYSIGGNFTLARRMMGESYKPRFGSSWDEYRNSTENRWASTFWGYEIAGRFENYEQIQNYPVDNDGEGNSTMLPGDFIYKDQNGDGVINELDERPIAYGAGELPYMNFSLNSSFEWKGFDLQMDWNGAAGQSYEMCWEVAYPFQGDGNSTEYLLTDSWHRVDPTDPTSDWVAGEFPATRYAGANVSFTRRSDFWVKKVWYLKLRTLELGYTLPKSVTNKMRLNRLRFYVNAYNLFSIDNMHRYQLDPEITSNSALVTPNLRTISFGLNLNF